MTTKTIPPSRPAVKDPHIGHDQTCDHCQGAGGFCSACNGKGVIRLYGHGWVTYGLLHSAKSPLTLSNLLMGIVVGMGGSERVARGEGRHLDADRLSKEAARLHAIAYVLADMPDGPGPISPSPAPPAKRLWAMARRFFGGQACA